MDQFDTETRISRRPCHVVPPSQQVPFALHALDDPVGARVAAEADQHLVEDDVVDHLGATGLEPVGEALGQHAAALHQVGDAVATQLAQRRPHGETPCPP